MSQQPVSVSEVAWLRERIAREHEAACWALTGLAVGTAKHLFISRRLERIGTYQQQLGTLIGEQASLEVVLAVMEKSPSQSAGEKVGTASTLISSRPGGQEAIGQAKAKCWKE